MIKSALLNKYRIQEFIQFITNILMIVKQHSPDKLKIKELYHVLNQNQEMLQEAYKQTANSGITPMLASLDAQRDQAIICLRMVCDGYTHHYDEKLKAAGKTVVACIDKYGNKLYHLNYSAETAALKNLVRDLETIPECVDAINDIQMKDVVNAMKNANIKFEKLFIQRLGEFSQYEILSTKALNYRTSEAYKTLVQHVEAHAILTPSEDYSSLINHLNENIEHFNQIVVRRKSGGEPEPEEFDSIDDEAVDSHAV